MKNRWVWSVMVIVHLRGVCSHAQIGQSAETNFADTKVKLVAFESGKLSLEELTASNNCDDLLTFYFAHTNEVTTKMKLPISRCFAGLGKYSEASNLAHDYVTVYSNDWHGWRIIGGSKLMLKSYEEAIAALTNAVRLGDEENYVGLGLAALGTNRLDILQSIVVPHLLERKDSGEINKRLDMIGILVTYSLIEGREDVFVKALEGLRVEDVSTVVERDDILKHSIVAGWKQFHPKKVEPLCREVEKRMQGTSGSASKE
jgi:hypothetical protein